MSQGLQSTNSNDGMPLFACTKCNSRVRSIEELSQGSQLCKDCKSSFQVLKCTYCRTEYQHESNGGGKPRVICKKCEHLQEQHGKPKPCAYCNIVAAFIGTRCQRCTNSEKKYGPPLSCDDCKQKCAFDRKDPESKQKVGGKLLCWLCTMSYKRTLAKARHKEAILKSASYGSDRHHNRLANGSESKPYSSSSSNRHQTNSSTSNGHRAHNSSSTAPGASNSSSSTFQRSSSHRHSQQSTSSSNNLRESSSSSYSSDNKKPRLDATQQPSNLGATMSSSLTETRFIDPNNSDLTAAMAQLKEQVAQLNKKVQIKEKELLSKDQQIADLKSTSAREHRELREKISSLQKQHSERISEMQTKLVTMQKQIASQTKASRPNLSSGIKIEPPLVI